MKSYKPTSPARRQMNVDDFSVLTRKRPEKKLRVRLPYRAGRSKTSGRITTRHKGGGEKRFYRIINFGQKKLDVPGKVTAIEYDPYRTAFIALIEYADGEKCYILAPKNVRAGDEILCSRAAPMREGNRAPLKNIPVGTMVHNIEVHPGRGGQLVRSAGDSAKTLAHEGKYTHIAMPSGEVRKILSDCFASIGSVSRGEHKYITIGSAGRARHMRRRPTVRGSAMNPVDHPHGGGEGRAPIGLKYPKTPWGKHARGVKTRRRRWTDKYILQRRKK